MLQIDLLESPTYQYIQVPPGNRWLTCPWNSIDPSDRWSWPWASDAVPETWELLEAQVIDGHCTKSQLDRREMFSRRLVHFDGYLMDIHSLLLFYRGISEARECFRNLQDSTGAWVNPKSLQSLKMWYFEATIAEMTCVDPCPRWWKEQRCLGVFERSYIYIIYLLYCI